MESRLKSKSDPQASLREAVQAALKEERSDFQSQIEFAVKTAREEVGALVVAERKALLAEMEAAVQGERKAREAALQGERNTREAALQGERKAQEAALQGERKAREAALQGERKAREAAVRQERQKRQKALRTTNDEIIRLREEAIVKYEAELQELDIVELHEAWNLTIQGFNDIIFNVERPAGPGERSVVLSKTEKNILKTHRRDWISGLFTAPPTMRRVSARDQEQLDKAVKKAIGILSLDEQAACKAAIKQFNDGRKIRNEQQHRRPDIATAVERTRQLPTHLHTIIATFLKTNPTRIRLQDEDPGVDLRLFAEAGSYKSVAEFRAELEKMKREKAEAAQRLSEGAEDSESKI